MKTIEFAFVPSPGMGHIFSAVEFAKRLIQRDERLSLTIFVISSPFHSPVDPSYTNQVSSSYPSIKFLDLPKITKLPDFSSTTNSEKQYSLFIDLFKTPVKDAITKNVLSNPNIYFAGVIMDFLCSAMFDVATEFGVPSYMFFPSGAALLSLMLYLPTHFSQKGSEFSESDPDSIIPGFTKPVPSKVVPTFCLSSDGGYEAFLEHSIRLKQSKGVFINTFLELEFGKDNANETFAEAPPIYTIGPIVNLETKNKPDLKRDRIIQWLNNQPSESVIFLCFGSFGSFGEAQLANIATALEHSGHRFLWSIRKKLSSQPFSPPGDYEDFGEALPKGFLERTKDRGLVCGWAPQLEVLANEAVGCFVTHCGWNSVLESIWFGKTIVTWPLYAEQQLNAFQLVKEMGVAVDLTIDFRYEKEEIVEADVIEKAVKSAMDVENPVRKRVKEMSEIGRKATEEGGSSFNSINRFVQHLLENNTIKNNESG